jgi:hypothetical protein
VNVSRPAAHAIAVLFALGTSASASAETLNCIPITSLPFTITAKGIYCLTGDLNTSITTGNALEIAANNVIVDLNGHKIAGQAAGAGTTATGIYANQRQNITIRNGTIRGYFYGIWLDDVSPYTASQGHLVEEVRLDRNLYVGIAAFGRGCLIRRNQVTATGGTTAFGADAFAYAISASGNGQRIVDNDVMTVTKAGTGSGYGIALATAGDNLVVNNRVTRADYAVSFPLIANAGKYRDNLTDGITVSAYSGGGVNAGNNN